jgi:hypothetical protein
MYFRNADGPATGTSLKKLELELGDIQTKLEKLRRHASWLTSQIPFIMNIQRQLSWGELKKPSDHSRLLEGLRF